MYDVYVYRFRYPKMKMQYWTIVDSHTDVVGEYFCGIHYVPIYSGKRSALDEAKSLPFRTCVVKATPEVMQLKPSEYSTTKKLG